jgi:hypothetical protein
MSANELIAIALPLGLAAVLIGVALLGSRLRIPHRRSIERFVFLPLWGGALIAFTIDIIVNRRWADIVVVVCGAIAIYRICRRFGRGGGQPTSA